MTIQKIDATSPEAQSADLKAQNIAKLRELFPELLTERIVDGKTEATINVDTLKALVGDQIVTDAEERYGLNWHGKRRARQLALTPSIGTLRPCEDDSVDWSTTQNLMIEGDNLEVLKLLQKSYAGKVKLIYIDPPYNTGKDFVYPDDFRDNLRNYLAITNQSNNGAKIRTNIETSGRFHTDWLNMMLPRLKLAHSLLHSEGGIFVSCDDSEVANFKAILNEIFGEECFVAQFVWKARKFTDSRTTTNVSTDHEYILAYAKSSEFAVHGIERDETKFNNLDNDPRGPWMSRSLLGLANKEQRPNLHYVIVEPVTGRRFPPDPSSGWRYSRERMAELISDGRILFPKKDDGRPREKKFRVDMNQEFIAFRSIIDDIHTSDGTQEIRSLFGNDVFSFPKPTQLIRKIIKQATSKDDICLDFFAGSGTTAEAVMQQNALDNGRRRYILVQLPEPLDPNNKEQKNAAEYCDSINKPRCISELTKERLRRSGESIKSANPIFDLDIGFRVFKLDASNIRLWNPDQDNLDDSILANLDHTLPGRTDADILFEVLIKRGLDLCVPIESRTISGKTVESVGIGVLMVCLAQEIKLSEVEELALGIAKWRQELTTAGETVAIFRDSAFVDDVVKSNLAAILEQNGIKTVRSL